MNKIAAGLGADTTVFSTKLQKYKNLLDDDIAAYCKEIQRSTLQQYGAYARVSIDAYVSILQRGGKRIRGALTMLGYEMSGGTDMEMILQAARAVEMMQAYILIVDDFQDRSDVRRGGPSAHKLLADYHRKKHLAGDSQHFGEAIAMNAALAGNHAAQMVLANLDTDPELRLKAISIFNLTMLITSHGQTNDIMNEVVGEVTEADVDKVLEWKTAHYTILNPLHIGMVLAGAECDATDAITAYAMHAGRAFQITDDILGTFGEEFESGKSPLDDIREGKRTLLTVYALEHAKNGNKNFLLQMLGNSSLSLEQFGRCKQILVESGGLAYAQKAGQKHVEAALAALEGEKHRWNPEGILFLQGLANYLLSRTS